MTEHIESVKLRPAVLEDIKALYDLDQKLFPPHIRYDIETFLAAQLAPSALVIVAEIEESMAGFIIALADWETRGVIITVDVAPDRQRKGVGAKLMRKAEEGLKVLGSEKIALQVAVENEGAIAFYKKLGYEITETIEGYYSGIEDAYTMELSINS